MTMYTRYFTSNYHNSRNLRVD